MLLHIIDRGFMFERSEDQHRWQLLSLHLQNLMALEEARASDPETARWESQRQEVLGRIDALVKALQLAPTRRSLAALSRLTDLAEEYAHSLAQRERSLKSYIQKLEILEAGESRPGRIILLRTARQLVQEIAGEQTELSGGSAGQDELAARSPVITAAIQYARQPSEVSGAQSAEYGSSNPSAAETSDTLKHELHTLLPGVSDAARYESLILNILTYVFSGDLIDGRSQESTFDGTERRDLVFMNQSDHPFWQYVRQQYGSYLLMFEAKNVTTLDSQHINQVSAYLGDRLGRFGFIVTRNSVRETQMRKIMTVFNDSYPKKVILVLDDRDMRELISHKMRNHNPTEYIQQIYRKFKLRLQ